ncbi:MAG: PAS domain-containing protein [Clostridia bacterium]|nr:PAS domain-containing protein [Clostridia bacterium]
MEKLLNRHQFTFDQVMYATRNGRKTVLHMETGDTLETFLPIRRLIEQAPANLFVSVNKGVVLAFAYISGTEGSVYIMKDGVRFQGRARQKPITRPKSITAAVESGSEWDRFALLDELPLAFCVIELVFDEHGRGMDFIFRYCNKEMEVLEGKSIDEMLNRSFYEVFENGDRKWLVAYADVALNGVKRTLESYSPEINANLKIYCYQPKPNFCACVLVKLPGNEE